METEKMVEGGMLGWVSFGDKWSVVRGATFAALEGVHFNNFDHMWDAVAQDAKLDMVPCSLTCHLDDEVVAEFWF